MHYAAWLFGLSVAFVLLERLWPRHPQGLLRRGIVTDLIYLIFNSEYLGVLLGTASIYLVQWLRVHDWLDIGVMRSQPFWIQFPVLVLVMDFSRYLIHNMLHRVGWLWEFHKVHHSIEQLDWIGNWRFHWFEVVVYDTLLYIPAAFFGFRADAMFWFGVVNTAVGHFAHSNLNIWIGPLKYILNSPEMHQWHHNHPDAGPVNKNFGVSLALWDWIFGTAYLPPHRDPERLGFKGIERYPGNVFGQLIAPFRRI